MEYERSHEIIRSRSNDRWFGLVEEVTVQTNSYGKYNIEPNDDLLAQLVANCSLTGENKERDTERAQNEVDARPGLIYIADRNTHEGIHSATSTRVRESWLVINLLNYL